jgi:CRP/FNR family cyclic AMP-dependent transcriptional regulator
MPIQPEEAARRDRNPMAAIEQRPENDPFAGSSVLGMLTADDRRRLTERCVERRFEKGQIVYFEGQVADSMLVLTAGHLKVSTFSADGNELVIATIAPGETIGELGVLSTEPRSATVTSTAASRALVLSRSVVMELIERQPALAVAMLQRLADMVRATTESASDLVFLDLNQRVAKFLIERAGGSTGEIHVIQADLAAAIGASRQRVNASLQEFQRREWISLSSRKVRLLDPEALRRLARP